MTTRVRSVSIPVADQDRALAFYTEVLGCELRTDIEVWPGNVDGTVITKMSPPHRASQPVPGHQR
jgi:catechol 2,3-dioxygenase-like lactoylglutathione lyase family enzyme